MSDDNAEKSRRVIDKMLRDPRRDDVSASQFLMAAHDIARGEGFGFEWAAAVEYWWDLARAGAIALVGGETNFAGRYMFVVTDFGRKVLAGSAEVSPHDRKGYLATLRTNPATDDIALGYADEAVGAWQAGLSRASAVMLGCACERLVILMAEAVAGVSISPYSDDLKRLLSPPSKKGGEAKPAGISQIFERVRGAVDVVTRGDDEFDRNVTAIFEHTRLLRNASGHPSGAIVSRDDAHAGLLLFPGFYRRAIATIARIKAYQP